MDSQSRDNSSNAQQNKMIQDNDEVLISNKKDSIASKPTVITTASQVSKNTVLAK